MRTASNAFDFMATILIVDDDPTIRAMFTRALSGLANIDVAINGGDALRQLGAKKFALVLLDLHMPVMDGFVVLHTLANKPGVNKDTPIYVVTADMSEQARIRALRRNAVFFLTKPVPLATLTTLVDASLKKTAARAQQLLEGNASSTPPPPEMTATPTPPPPKTTTPTPKKAKE